VQVTAETAPHYFSLTEELLTSFNTSLKVNPPLRSARDVEAIKEGLKDGTIDVIATDHAPHSSLEKDIEFDYASPGMVGLETALPLALRLIDEGIVSLPELVAKLTAQPAKILGVQKGTLSPGREADISVVDPSQGFTVDVSTFKSKSKNSPFDGWDVRGKVFSTLVKGKVIYENGLLV
jgi:dihydroorotase